MPFDLPIPVLAAAGLVLASAWVNFTLLGREKSRWQQLRQIWGALDVADVDTTSQASLLCRRVRETLGSPYCSLWVLGPQSGLFRPIAHDGAPVDSSGDNDSDSTPSMKSTVPGEVPTEIVSRAWTTGHFQEFSSTGHRWIVQPVAPKLEGGGALVVRMTANDKVDPEILKLAAVPAATLAVRMGHDRELQRTRRELDDVRAEMIEESKLAAVGRLAAGVAHELNTPLGAVLTMVGSLSRDAADADKVRRFGIIREGVEKCKSIIEKLLVFSRGPVETEEGLTFSRFVRAPMELNRIIRESVELLSEPFEQEGIAVKVELGDIPPIRANSTQWGQVITNLLANARDAFRSHKVESPTITVRTSTEGNRILLAVSDNGPGIPANVVGRIFDPFFTTKDIGKGTGLGLAIVREIVKKHDGTVEVQTREGEGTTFLIRVPVGAAAAGGSGPAENNTVDSPMDRILQDRYRVLHPLGRGGLGSVYLCSDLRLAGQHWALKKMHRPQAELHHKFRETFEREARTLAGLRHPNLPTLVDYFEEGEDCYLVTEFVEGENLAEHVRRLGPLAETRTFELGLILSELLVFLHAQNPPIIFRDLKPENVMLNAEGVVKLVDFGLARRFNPAKHRDTVPSGSAGYAPPEQWEDLSQTDARSDVYSWGATMVYLLSGKVPSPVYPMAALQGLSPSPRAVALLSRSLKARPSERFSSAQELWTVVRGFLNGEEVPSAPTLAEPPHERVDSFSSVAPVVRAEAAAVSPPQRHGSMATAPAPPPQQQGGTPSTTHQRLPLVLLMAATTVFLLAAARYGLKSYSSAAAQPYSVRFVRDEKMEEGRRYYREGRYAAAIEALDQATTVFPDDAIAYILKEDAYARMGGGPVVTVPFLGSMSGANVADSFSQFHGLALAQSVLNAHGGVAGKKLVVELYDDESSTARCLELAEKLARDPNNLVVLGPYSSQRTLAIAPLFNAAHVSLISPTASSQRVWEAGPYVFSAADSTDRRVRALAWHIARAGYRKVGTIVDQTSRLSGEMARTFTAAVAPKGVTVVPLPGYRPDQTDFSAQVTAIRQTDPDFILFCDFNAEPVARFAVQLRAQNVQTPLCSQAVPFSKDLVELGGDAVSGVLLSGYFHPAIDTPAAHAFMLEFRRKFGTLTPTHIAVNTYDALTAVAEALRHASTREELHAYFSSSGKTRPPFEGVSGRFALGRRLDQRPVWVIEVRNGLYQLLEQADESALGGG